jgi:L-asparaginase
MVQIFTTGGTIDKEYFDAQSAYHVGEPLVGEILREAGVTTPFQTRRLMRKDSLELQDADRAAIREAVLTCEAQRVVVTHGTDTMVQTAQAIGDPDGRTVVLVGSLSPARFRETDALFNVGFAFAAAQTLPAGVWIAMNGRVFAPSNVRKNREANRFEPLTD